MDRVHEHDFMVGNGDISNEEESVDDETSDKSVYVDSKGNTNDTVMNQIKGNDPHLTSLKAGFLFFNRLMERAIGRNTHLKELRLSWMLNANFNHLCRGLTSNRSIQLLNFDAMGGIDVYGEGAQILANDIMSNALFKELEMIPQRSMSHKEWLEILAAMHANPNCRIETFVLCSYDINEGAAILLSNVLLCHTNTLTTLKLCCNRNVTRAFCRFLQNPNSVLVKLNLSCNAIRDDVAAALTNAFINNSRLRELDFSTNRSITPTGWMAFLTVLLNPISVLEKLNLSCNEMINEVVEAVTTSLAANTRLRELKLSCNFNVTTAGWVTFSKCSTQSQHSVGETAHACQFYK